MAYGIFKFLVERGIIDLLVFMAVAIGGGDGGLRHEVSQTIDYGLRYFHSTCFFVGHGCKLH